MIKTDWTRHPLRKKATLLAIIDRLVVIALAVGVQQELVDMYVAIAGAIVAIGVELGIFVKKAEEDVTPVDDPRVPTGDVESVMEDSMEDDDYEGENWEEELE